MKGRSIVSLAYLFLSIAATAGATSAWAQTADATTGITRVRSNDPSRPAAVPSDYVVTPFGYYHPSCVQAVDSTEKVNDDGSIQRKDGTTRSVPTCTHPAYLRNGTRIEPNDTSNHALRQPTTYNGYLQLVSVVLGSGASSLTATMTVPPNPTEQSGQTLYFFPGLEDYQDVVTILQPVLGWDGYGANNWTITSWNCCNTGSIYHGNNVVVAPGDVIFGSMVSNADGTWTVTAKDQTNTSLKPAVLLSTRSFGQTFDWIFAGALETYGVTDCGQFPASGPITYGSITTLVGGTPLANPAWSVDSSSGSPASCTSATVVNATTVNIGY